jgi:hypothetical protein
MTRSRYRPALARQRHDDMIAKARHALRSAPTTPPESYLAAFALVGVLGGITMALIWLTLAPRFWG